MTSDSRIIDAPLLDQAIASLSTRDQTVIVERYLRGRSVDEVAAVEGLTNSATQKRVERAVEKLRVYFHRHAAKRADSSGAFTAALTAAAPSLSRAAPSAVRNAVITMPPIHGPIVAVAKAIGLTLAAKRIAAGAGVALAIVAVTGAGLCGSIELAHLADAAPSQASVRPAAPAAGPVGFPTIADQPLSATLAGGISVELLGISENPSAGRPWWRPNGAAMKAPHAKCNGSVSDHGAGLIVREFAYSLQTPAGADSLFWVDGTRSSAGGGAINSWGWSIDGLTAMAMSVPDRPAVARFSIAAGPWHTVDEINASGGIGHWSKSTSAVHFAAPTDSSQTTPAATIVASTFGPRRYPVNQDLRLVAINADGKEWPGFIHESRGSLIGSSETYQIDGISAYAIKSIRLESRPYDRWVEFRNISLHAGEKTEPTMLIHYDALRVPTSTTRGS